MNTLKAIIRTAFQYPDIRNRFFITMLFALSMLFVWYIFWYTIDKDEYSLEKCHLKNINDDISISQKKRIVIDNLILKNDILYDQIRRQSSQRMDSLAQQFSSLLELLPAQNAQYLHCQPGKILQKDFYDKLPVEVEIHISYEQFRKFVELLGSKKIFYTFNSLVIEPLEEFIHVRMLCVLYSITQESATC